MTLRRASLSLFVILALILAALGAATTALAPTARADDPDTMSDSELVQRQKDLDAEDEPSTREATDQGPEAVADGDRDGESSIDEIAEPPADATEPDPGDDAPYALRTSHLTAATAVDPAAVTFSWSHAVASAQTGYRITVYKRADLADLVCDSGEQGASSAAQTSVTVAGCELDGNQLYYWRVEAEYADGARRTSAPTAFVTAAGSAMDSARIAWTPPESGKAAVSALLRAVVPAADGVEKAVLTATALDTEISRRHVFSAYANGVEVGVGPARRAGNTVYYNVYDVTEQLHPDSDNVVGLYAYSQAKTAGVAVLLTYFYSDGSSDIVYSSTGDVDTTRITAMDDVVYGTSGASIGTQYYRELAQNADTTRFPYGWQDADFDDSTWTEPVLAERLPEGFALAPAIVAATTRAPAAPSTITRNSDGSWTVDFGREIIGDVSLTATAQKKRGVRITLGEELNGQKARYKLRTGNVYDETWQFQGTDVTFSGYSLKGFRYVTLYNYDGTLTKDRITALDTVDPTDAGTGSLTTDSDLLNRICALGEYSQAEATLDTVVDSVTRERRAYEGDTLIYQALTEDVSGNVMAVRNTWNYLIVNPSQYTEYRLMTILGVHDDYMRTADVTYADATYENLQSLLGTVRIDSSTGLARADGNTVDLVDWPRSETPGYNFSTTTYKTAINAVAYRAYRDMADLARATGRTGDATTYDRTADKLRGAIDSKLFDTASHTYIDGLTKKGQRVTHAIAQNTYMVVAMEATASPERTAQATSTMIMSGGQAQGSIYMAFFFYRALAVSGRGDSALTYLTDTSGGMRTYHRVLNSLGATMAPEAWDPSLKPNMTFSHAWGAGGAAGLVDSVALIRPATPGGAAYELQVGLGRLTRAEVVVPTLRGPISVDLSRTGTRLAIDLDVPADTSVQLSVRGADLNTGTGAAADQLAEGTHTLTAQLKGPGTDTFAVRRGNAYYVKNSITSGQADTIINYGKPGDAVLVGDWDSDGQDTFAVRRGNQYYVKNSIAPGEADTIINYGKPGDAVLVGDWDGDGKDTFAVRRGNAYYVKNSIAPGEADKTINYGKTQDTVLVGDWDGR